MLRRPGQLFVVSHGLRAPVKEILDGKNVVDNTLEQWTYLEFADGDKVEVRYVR